MKPDPEELKTPDQQQKEKLDMDILSILNSVERISAKDIVGRLNIDWKDDKMKRYLGGLEQVKRKKIGRYVYFYVKKEHQKDLFSDIDID